MYFEKDEPGLNIRILCWKREKVKASGLKALNHGSLLKWIRSLTMNKPQTWGFSLRMFFFFKFFLPIPEVLSNRRCKLSACWHSNSMVFQSKVELAEITKQFANPAEKTYYSDISPFQKQICSISSYCDDFGGFLKSSIRANGWIKTGSEKNDFLKLIQQFLSPRMINPWVST